MVEAEVVEVQAQAVTQVEVVAHRGVERKLSAYPSASIGKTVWCTLVAGLMIPIQPTMRLDPSVVLVILMVLKFEDV
jgi:hypothetical protein